MNLLLQFYMNVYGGSSIIFMWFNLLCVFCGGGLGTACRTELQHLLPTAWYPIAIINLIGSILMGIFAGYFSTKTHTPSMHRWFIFLGTGFCGGFTTMSSFALELMHAHSQTLYIYLVMFIISFLCTFLFYRKSYEFAQQREKIGFQQENERLL